MSSPFATLADAFRLYRANAAVLGGYAAWLLLTAAAFVLLNLAPDGALNRVAFFAVQVADILLWLWVVTMTMLLTARIRSGAAVDVAALPRDAWARVGTVALAMLLQLVATLGGYLLLIIPGFVFLVWFAFAPQAAAIDGKRGLEALAHSRMLVSGRFFDVAWRLFVGPFALFVGYLAVVLVAVAVICAVAGTSLASLVANELPLWVDVLASVLEIFLLPLVYVYWGLVYLELKENDEKG